MTFDPEVCEVFMMVVRSQKCPLSRTFVMKHVPQISLRSRKPVQIRKPSSISSLFAWFVVSVALSIFAGWVISKYMIIPAGFDISCLNCNKMTIVVGIFDQNMLEKLPICLNSLEMQRCSKEIIIGSRHPINSDLHSRYKVLNFPSDTATSVVYSAGARSGGGKYISFLHGDCKLGSTWCADMRSWLNHEDVGIVGSKVYDTGGRIMHAGLKYYEGSVESYSDRNMPVPFFLLRGADVNAIDSLATMEIDAVIKLGMGIRRKDFELLDGFDHSLSSELEYSLAEDLDLCARMSLQLKKRVIYCAKCTIQRILTLYSSPQKTLGFSGYSEWVKFFSRHENTLQARVRKRYQTNRPLQWFGLFSNPSGFGSEAISFVIGLENYIPVKIVDLVGLRALEVAPFDVYIQETLIRLRDKKIDRHQALSVTLWTPDHVICPLSSSYCVGRNMFETFSLPNSWTAILNSPRINEIWVPTVFNKDSFVDSGVSMGKVVVIPQAIDRNTFHNEQSLRTLFGNSKDYITTPTGASQLPFHDQDTFIFLSVFEWTRRKDPETLLKSYFAEFSRNDNVVLVIKSFRPMHHYHDDSVAIYKEIESIARKYFNSDYRQLARVHVIGDQILFQMIPSLYSEANAFVLPSHGEAWGRPYMEAMAMGIPVIAPDLGPHRQYMTHSNAFLVQSSRVKIADGMAPTEDYEGHDWVQVSSVHLSETMRNVFEDRIAARSVGEIGQHMVMTQYNVETVCGMVVSRVKEIDINLNSKVKIVPRISIYITYRTFERLRMVLSSLSAVLAGERPDVEVILASNVDNINEYELLDFVEQFSINLVYRQVLGFTSAIESAEMECSGRLVLFLSDDFHFFDLDILSLENDMDNSGVGAVGAYALDATGSRVISAGYERSLTGLKPIKCENCYLRFRTVDYIDFDGLVMRKSELSSNRKYNNFMEFCENISESGKVIGVSDGIVIRHAS